MKLRTNGISGRIQANAVEQRIADFAGTITGGETRFDLTASTGPKKFSILAYAGGPFSPKVDPPLKHPIVLDLKGVQFRGRVRALKDHQPSQLVGHVTKHTVDASGISLDGVVSGSGPAAREVVEAAANGFEWEASIGASFSSAYFVPPGKSVIVNGRNVEGPVYVARASRIDEVSFVVMGADSQSSAKIAAKPREGVDMSFEEWLKANGFDVAALSETQRGKLQAAYTAEMNVEGGDESEPDEKPAKKPAKRGKLAAAKPAGKVKIDAGDDAQSDDTGNASGDIRAQIREEAAAEFERVEAIKAACPGNGTLAAQAIREGWTVEKTELAYLKASTPRVTGGIVSRNEVTSGVLEAALCQSVRMPSDQIESDFDERTLEAAHKRFKGRLSLHEFLMEAAYVGGYTGGVGGIKRDVEGVLRAAFSTTDISNILSNTANKSLLAGYNGVEAAWREVASVSSNSDFKTATRVRLLVDGAFEKVGPAGVLQHGKLNDQSFTNTVETFGQLFSLTRQQIINDDLSAISSMPNMIGRIAAERLNREFWGLWNSSAATFWTSTKLAYTQNGVGGTQANYLTGATTALSIDALAAAEAAINGYFDPNGMALTVSPEVLLVPPGLKRLADQIYNSTETRDTTASTHRGTSNEFGGRFRPVMSRYLADTTLTGNSAIAWYLLSRNIPVADVAFLNGNETPTIEQAAANFNTLGVDFRGYWDFGVAMQDPRGGIRCKGSA